MNQRGMWQLILMAQEGDRQAIDELFYSSFRCAYLVLQTITADQRASLDILRETYFSIFQNLDSADRSKSFFEQLNASAIDRAKALFPSKDFLQIDKKYEADSDDFRANETEIHDFDTLPNLRMSKTADKILEVLHKLPIEQQLCTYLFYYAECTPESIAGILHTTRKCVCGALAAVRRDALPKIEAEARKSPALRSIDAESTIPWALRNTEEYTLSPQDMEEYHHSVLDALVDHSVLDTSMTDSDAVEIDESQMREMKPIRDHHVLKSIFSLRTLIIVLSVLLLAGLAIGLRQLKLYNRKHRELGQIISRTTLPLSTTAFASEQYIFSTEYEMPTETTTEEPPATTEAETEALTTTEKPTAASTTNPYADFTYTETGSTVTITGYTGSKSNPEIPDKINGKTIVGIGDRAFANADITGIKLPAGLQGIGKSAFHSCTGLQTVSLPASVTLIESDAFRNCTNLKGISLSDSLQKIGSNAFYKCSSLTTVTLPDRVTYLGDAAFSGCTTLSTITIPNSVTYLGSSLFYECKSLTKCTIGGSSKVKALGDSMFYDCTSLTSFAVPSGVRAIPANCFFCCRSLSSVTLPTVVTSIGANAFMDCISLDSIRLSNDLHNIDKNAFSGCTSLKSVTIPSSCVSIGDSAFSNCSNLRMITIPASVTQIGSKAFFGCDDLQISCPDHSAAEKYAIANNIDIYGRINEMTYANANSIE